MRLPSRADAVRASLYQDSLRDYIHAAWPLVDHHQFKSNWHIDAIAEHLEAVSSGEIRRLIINIPPRPHEKLGCWRVLADVAVVEASGNPVHVCQLRTTT